MSGFPEDESAWLIEMDGPLYWSGRDGCRAWWSVADAVRFCRWDDADRLRRLMGFEKARVREHVWPRTVMPAVVRPVPSVEPEPPPAPAQAGWTERPMSVIHDALDRTHRRACGETGIHYMSIPPNFERDADLILSDAIEELEKRRAAKVRVKLPIPFGGTPFAYYEAVERALRSAGVEAAAMVVTSMTPPSPVLAEAFNRIRALLAQEDEHGP